MSDVQFTLGVFRDFRATVTFHLGKITQDVKKDAVVQFDGTTLKLDGLSHSIPELRSAIKAGWLALVGSSVSDYVPQSADVKVRSVQGGTKGKMASTEVQQDETFVSPIHKNPVTVADGVQIQSKVFNPTLIRDTEGDGRSVGSATKKAALSVTDATSDGEVVARIKTPLKKSFTLDGSTSMNAGIDETTDKLGTTREGQSSESGKVIANVGASTRRKVTLTDANSATTEISKLENATRVALVPKGKRDIAAMAGDKLEDILPVNEPENRGRILAEQARAQRLAQLAAQEDIAEEIAVMNAGKSAVVMVTPPPGAIDAPVKAKPLKSVEDFAVNGDDLEIAPGIRWNKKISWKLRVKQALQYRSQPEVLALIRAYEVPSVVKGIDAALK